MVCKLSKDIGIGDKLYGIEMGVINTCSCIDIDKILGKTNAISFYFISESYDT